MIRLSRLDVLPAAFAKFLRLPVFFNPIWVVSLLKVIKAERINVLHVHDLPLAPLATLIGKLLSIPVIYDMHENYPAAMTVWAQRLSWFQRAVKNPKIAVLLNRFVLKYADRVIVVVEEQRDNLINSGITGSKIFLVGNTVDIDEFLDLPVDQEIQRRYSRYFVILYVGSFAIDRGLETAINAMKYVLKDISNARLMLVGSGKNFADLQKLSNEEGMNDAVEFVGWVPFSKVASYMAASSICIIPQPSNAANDSTIPHKLFQYMLLEKPVLVSDAAPLKRIVNECRCGEVFRSNDPKDFARAVVLTAKSSVAYGANGRKCVFENYNWAQTSRSLIELYHSL